MNTEPQDLHQHQAIVSIATEATQRLRFFTFVFVLIYFIGSFVVNLHSQYINEQNRLSALSPSIARGLYGEILSGDTVAFEKMRVYLIEKNKIQNIFYGTSSGQCKNSPFWMQLFKSHFKICWSYQLDSTSSADAFQIESKIQKKWLSPAILGFIFAALPLVFFILLFFRKIQKVLNMSIAIPLQSFSKDPEKWKPDGTWVAREIVTLSDQLKDYIRQRDQERDRAEILHRKAYMGDIAAQVAHDIRSPLAAFNLLSNSLKLLPDQDRSNVQKAVARIQHIAQDLIQKYRAQHSQEELNLTTEHLASLLDQIILEKQILIQEKTGIHLISEHRREAYGNYVKVSRSDFFRAISNILDNAFEALDGKGSVRVQVFSDQDRVTVSIEDSGKGMSPEILQTVRTTGGSHGKTQGLGLGLPRAKAFIKSWGGQLDIDSIEGQWTRIRIHLPKKIAPEWHLNQIQLHQDQPVVVLDDDPTIHAFWSTHLGSHPVQLFYASTQKDFHETMERLSPEQKKQALYLMDYELKEEGKIGLNIISDLGLMTQSILVTSHTDDASVQKTCTQLGIKLVSKDFLGAIPISIREGNG